MLTVILVIFYFDVIQLDLMYHFQLKYNMHAIRNDIFYIDHMSIADFPASPSKICKLANYPSFLAMTSNYAISADHY